jgi:hypothetical protein
MRHSPAVTHPDSQSACGDSQSAGWAYRCRRSNRRVSVAMVAVVRRQRLEQGVAVHLESQHGFHVTPGVGHLLAEVGHELGGRGSPAFRVEEPRDRRLREQPPDWGASTRGLSGSEVTPWTSSCTRATRWLRSRDTVPHLRSRRTHRGDHVGEKPAWSLWPSSRQSQTAARLSVSRSRRSVSTRRDLGDYRLDGHMVPPYASMMSRTHGAT